MGIIQSFDTARAADFDALSFATGTRDYLVLTGKDIHDKRRITDIVADRTYMHLLSDADEANEMLNTLTRWLRQNNILDQRPEFGDDRASYCLCLYRVSESGTVYPSLVNDFMLEEYLFPDRCLADAHSAEDFMRMIDRDRLAEDMRRTLAEEFGMRIREEAPQFWRRDMRGASHPDWKPF